MYYAANLELSKELYDLSGWETSNEVTYRMEKGKPVATNAFDGRARGTIPVYELGYLLRKLPARTLIKREYDASLERPEETPAHYRALYDTVDDRHFWLGGDTPEDAAAMLAIELFKRGIFSK